jgi:hypothetical protein
VGITFHEALVTNALVDAIPGLPAEDVLIDWLGPQEAQITIAVSTPSSLDRASIVDAVDSPAFEGTLSVSLGVTSSERDRLVRLRCRHHWMSCLPS